jgi:hypothetical protein
MASARAGVEHQNVDVGLDPTQALPASGHAAPVPVGGPIQL